MDQQPNHDCLQALTWSACFILAKIPSPKATRRATARRNPS